MRKLISTTMLTAAIFSTSANNNPINFSGWDLGFGVGANYVSSVFINNIDLLSLSFSAFGSPALSKMQPIIAFNTSYSFVLSNNFLLELAAQIKPLATELNYSGGVAIAGGNDLPSTKVTGSYSIGTEVNLLVKPGFIVAPASVAYSIFGTGISTNKIENSLPDSGVTSGDSKKVVSLIVGMGYKHYMSQHCNIFTEITYTKYPDISSPSPSFKESTIPATFYGTSYSNTAFSALVGINYHFSG